MGSGSFDAKAYQQQAQQAKSSENSGFTATSMCDEFNPLKVKTRFSKTGPFNGFRDVITGLIGLDVTGSMKKIPKSLLEGKLGNLMEDLKKTFNRPYENLQISFAGIGDAKSDRAPLQVTHFESDNRFAKQLQKIWLEGGGGGNGAESYNLLWWYAANKTHLNYTQRDNRKGILVTIGDDNVHQEGLTSIEIKTYLDPEYNGGDISNQVLLKGAREHYEIYHIVITDGDSYERDFLRNQKKTDQQKIAEAQQWTNLLGSKNVIFCKSAGVADAIAEIVKLHRPHERANTVNLTEEEWDKQNKKNLTDKQWEEILSYTLCPLTRKFMNNPVSLGDGKRAFEKQAIEHHVNEHQSDPITHQKLSKSEVFKPNLNIAQLCSTYKPYFDSLPENRRERLIQTVLSEMIVEHKKVDESMKNPQTFFAKSEPLQGNKKHEKIPENIQLRLACPITNEIMEDPVMLIDSKQTYERKAIEKWLEGHNTDPVTNKELKDKTLIPNYALKSLCEEARKSHSSDINPS